MPPDDTNNILGSTARINLDAAAMDALSDKAAEAGADAAIDSSAMDHLSSVQAQSDAGLYFDSRAMQSARRAATAPVDDGLSFDPFAARALRQAMAPPPSPYQQYAQQMRDVESQTRDFYANLGQSDMIGTPIYKNMVAQNLLDQGVIDEHGYDARIEAMSGEKWSIGGALRGTEGAFAIGYGAMSLGPNISQAWQGALSGQAYLPDQAIQQTESSFLPVAGSIIGTIAGSRLGPGGSMGGQFVGQSVGQGIQEAWDSYATGHTFQEETDAQSYSIGRGGIDSSAVREFTDALRSAATPAVGQLADTLKALNQSGPITPGAASYFGQAQFSMGTAFAPAAMSAESALSSSPFFAGLNAQFLSGSANSQDLVGAAMAQAESGNFSGGMSLIGFAQSANTAAAQNPQYNRDQRAIGAYDSLNPFEKFASKFGENILGQNDIAARADAARQDTRYEPQFRNGQDPAAKNEDIYNQFMTDYEGQQRTAAGLIGAGADIGADAALLRNRLSLGGGAATISAALPGVSRAASDGASAAEADITRLQNLASQYPSQASAFDAQIAQDRQRAAEMAGVPDALMQAAFTTGIQEDQSGFGLASASALYSGQSAAQMSGLYRSQEAALRGYADNSLADPALRSQLLTQALNLQHTNTVQQYAQQTGADEIGIGRSGLRVEAQTLYGGPQGYSQAYGQEFDAYTQKIADLTDQLRKGGMTYDETIQKEQQLIQTRAQAGQVASQEAQAYTSATTAIAGSGVSQAAAFAGVSRLTGGSLSALPMTGQELANLSSLITADNAGANNPALSPMARAGYASDSASNQLRQAQERLAQADYSPDPALQTRIYQDTGNLNRVSRSFLQSGNLDQIRQSVFGDINSELTGLGTQEDALRRQQGGRIYDYQNAAFERQRQDLLSQRADIAQEMDTSYFDKLPAMVVGGTSFMGRYLPSESQAALQTERMGFGTLAARNFGFQDTHSYQQVLGQSGDLYAAGHQAVALQPSNLTTQAIQQVSFAPGSEIVIRMVMPDGTTQRVSGQVQQTAGRQSGMGIVPGVGR